MRTIKSQKSFKCSCGGTKVITIFEDGSGRKDLHAKPYHRHKWKCNNE